MVPSKRFCHKEYTRIISSGLKVKDKVIFQKKVKVQGQEIKNYGTIWKGLVTRNIHEQYESSISHGFWFIVKVKVFLFGDQHWPDHNTTAMTQAPRTFVPRLLKIGGRNYAVNTMIWGSF